MEPGCKLNRKEKGPAPLQGDDYCSFGRTSQPRQFFSLLCMESPILHLLLGFCHATPRKKRKEAVQVLEIFFVAAKDLQSAVRWKIRNRTTTSSLSALARPTPYQLSHRAPVFEAETVLQANIQDGAFPETAATASSPAALEALAKLRQHAVTHQQAHPIDFDLTNEWNETVSADKRHYREHRMKDLTGSNI